FTPLGNLKVSFNSGGSTGAIYFLWHFGDGLDSTSTEPNPTHTYKKDSTYHVCLDVKNGTNCAFTTCRNISPTGIVNISHQNIWKIYPEPFTTSLFISFDKNNKEIQRIEISDLMGRIIFIKNVEVLQSSSLQLNLSELAEGMYYLK